MEVYQIAKYMLSLFIASLSCASVANEQPPIADCLSSDFKKSRLMRWDDKKIMKSFYREKDSINSERLASSRVFIYDYPPGFGYHINVSSIENGVKDWNITLWMADNPNIKSVRMSIDNKEFDAPLFDIPNYNPCSYVNNGQFLQKQCSSWERSQFAMPNDALNLIIKRGDFDSLMVKFVFKDNSIKNCGISIFPREFILMKRQFEKIKEKREK